MQIDQIVHFTLGTMFSSKQHYKFKTEIKGLETLFTWITV